MKNRIADQKSGEKSPSDGINELKYAQNHKFDFIRSEINGGIKNIKQTIESEKNKILARNKNFTAMNNYKDSDTLASTGFDSHKKNLSHIKTHAELDKLLNDKVTKIKDLNKPTPKARNAHVMTLNGLFDKAEPNFKPKERKKVPFESHTEKNVFGHRATSIDPSYTTYKPYGYRVDEPLVENLETQIE